MDIKVMEKVLFSTTKLTRGKKSHFSTISMMEKKVQVCRKYVVNSLTFRGKS